jgi:PadR family transcriptional regulator PadR
VSKHRSLTLAARKEALPSREPRPSLTALSSFVPRAYLIEHIFQSRLTILEVCRLIISPSMGTEKSKADLLPGTLDMLVLKILMRGHLHGYAIAQLIQQLSDCLLRIEEGSLYPALQRLELNGWIEGEWGLPANNRRARFYKLTPEGRKHLAGESARYRQVTGAVARIMGFA